MKSVIIFIIPLLSGASAFTIDVSSRITNGNIAAANQFPYSVSLQRVIGQNLLQIQRGHKCGGALVTLQHVLTAASCLYDDVNGISTLIVTSEYRVFAGSESLLQDADQNRIRTIANYTIHPEYVASRSVNNIAIVTLVQPFLATTVQPISLPDASFAPADFSLCQIASWGALNATATASYNLRYTTKYVYGRFLCESLYSQAQAPFDVISSMMCATSYDVFSSGCAGDVGAALICDENLAGILVQTTGCVISYLPEVYTRASNYTTWVQSITGGSAALQPGFTLFTLLTALFITLK